MVRERAQSLDRLEIPHHPQSRETTSVTGAPDEDELRVAAKEGEPREQQQQQQDVPEAISLTDCVGRKFRFPWKLAGTWKGMENLIRAAFVHIDSIYPKVDAGQYELCLPDGFPIERRHWDNLVKPGMVLKMTLLEPKDPTESAVHPPPQEDLSPRLPSPREKEIEPIIIDATPKDDRQYPEYPSHPAEIPSKFDGRPSYYPNSAERGTHKTITRADTLTSSILRRDSILTIGNHEDDDGDDLITVTSDSSRGSRHSSVGKAGSRNSSVKSHPSIFSVPTNTSKSGAPRRGGMLSFPKAKSREYDLEKRLRIHSCRCYERSDDYRVSASSRVQLLVSDLSAGTVGNTIQFPRPSLDTEDPRDHQKGHWM
jgi:hypothetical protein